MSEKKAENRFKNITSKIWIQSLIADLHSLCSPDPTPQAHLQHYSRHQLQPPFPLPTSPVDPTGQSLLASFPWLIAISQLPTQADTPTQLQVTPFRKPGGLPTDCDGSVLHIFLACLAGTVMGNASWFCRMGWSKLLREGGWKGCPWDPQETWAAAAGREPSAREETEELGLWKQRSGEGLWE